MDWYIGLLVEARMACGVWSYPIGRGHVNKKNDCKKRGEDFTRFLHLRDWGCGRFSSFDGFPHYAGTVSVDVCYGFNYIEVAAVLVHDETFGYQWLLVLQPDSCNVFWYSRSPASLAKCTWSNKQSYLHYDNGTHHRQNDQWLSSKCIQPRPKIGSTSIKLKS